MALSLVVGLFAAVVLAACSPGPRPDESDGADAETSLTSFLQALSDGEFATAVGLTTTAPEDFVCEAMTDDGTGEIAVAAPEIVRIEEDGDTATAEVAYRNPDEQVEQVEMTRVDGEWLVTVPGTWRIEVGFDAPVVAEVVIDDECRVPVVDSAASILAWPGNYRLDIVDPTGVIERFDSTLYRVPDGSSLGIDTDLAALPAVSELSLVTVQAETVALFTEMTDDCIASEFTSIDCPAVLTGAVPVDGARQSGDFAVVERIWTDDEKTWLFETGIGSIEVSRDGVIAPVEFRYRGSLDTDSAGTLTVDVG